MTLNVQDSGLSAYKLRERRKGVSEQPQQLDNESHPFPRPRWDRTCFDVAGGRDGRVRRQLRGDGKGR